MFQASQATTDIKATQIPKKSYKEDSCWHTAKIA